MNRFEGRVALVTGASSGIGASICKSLVEHGMKVVGIARHVETIEEMRLELKEKGDNLMAISCDVTKDSQVYSVFETIKNRFGGVDVCINNAGMSFKSSLLDGTPEEWRSVMDLNVIACCLFIKLTVASMKERNVDDGHIINIGSIAGHLLTTSTPVHFYSATKHALRAITEGVRLELREIKSHIRVSCVSPGLVGTDFIRRMVQSEEENQRILSSIEHLTADDCTRSVLHILSAPPHVEINDIIIRPVEQVA